MPEGPEDQARKDIDAMLEKAGWQVQSMDELNLRAGQGVAVREFPTDEGPVDYLLFVDREAAGVLEAKPEGMTLGGVAEQSGKYSAGLPEDIPHVQRPLPLAYESTGVETYFRDLRDPQPRSRPVFGFHTPASLSERLGQENTLRARLQDMPPLKQGRLYDCQFEAIQGLETSLSEGRPRSLIQMATGSGKTFTAVTESYRLLEHAKAKRVLFLVDRTNLGRQTEKEFQQYEVAGTGRKFTELYNTQLLTSRAVDPVSDVCISTIQRVYSMLCGEELPEEDEEESLYETTPSGRTREVVYNPDVPPETFDFIIVDECHRSIYNLWRQVLEYFDAFLIGLTATPSKQTFGFFNQNLVTEYPHERAVADGVNVGYDVYRIKTEISEEGSRVEAGRQVVKREKKTRRERIEELDEDLEYQSTQLDRSVTAKDQIRTVVQTFRDKIRTEIFPGREQVPKTLIFAKDDNHAEEILHIVREEFGRGNEFCKKITYKTSADPEELIKQFRNSPMPRIAVSVDMISTGTDIKPLEVLLFMRDVKSSVYFDQMKGRGTRTIDSTQLQAVSGEDARKKTHFVLVDAVGVTETDKTDTKPLERKPSISFEKLLKNMALGIVDEESCQSLANRLSRLDRALGAKDRAEINEALHDEAESSGHEVTDLRRLTNRLMDAADPDKQQERAEERGDGEAPTDEDLEAATEELLDEATRPLSNPDVRNTIMEVRRRTYITIDEISQDRVIEVGPAEIGQSQAQRVVSSFEEYIREHQDEITALQIFYNQPYGQRHLTLAQIKELAEAIESPPLQLTPETLWNAYAQLEKDKVKGAGERRLLTDIISLVRHAMNEDEELAPFHEDVEARFYEWLNRQDRQQRFSREQLEWLELIKEHLAANLTVEREDLQYAPFDEKGGERKAVRLFGRDQLNDIITELNEVVVA